jgi:peptidoglycan/xylan/chitin deacetylase (PgdA/CDA1 family)
LQSHANTALPVVESPDRAPCPCHDNQPMRLLCSLLCLCLPISVAFAADAPVAPAASPDRRITVTIDDLPWQRMAETAPDDLRARHAALLDQLHQGDVPVVGFVNEDKLEVDGVVQPERSALLEAWLDAGYDLGNHTYGHVDLHEVGIPAYQSAILRGERALRPMMAKRRQTPRWFRHPYLRAGRTPEDKAAVADFLNEHGYRIAPVTVDNGEWVWAFAYERVLDGQPDTPERMALLQRLRLGYVPYMLNKLDYYEQQSQALLGYNLPHILLLHANALNADAYAALIRGIERRGYRFITLDEAMRDPAYAREDGYRGRYGPSWLHRWAMAEKKPKEFYAGEPRVPKWVLDLADVESE